MSHIVSSAEASRYFFFVPPFFRHYVPGFRHIAERMKRRNVWLTEEIKKIITERKREIESMSEKEPIIIFDADQKDTNRIKSSEVERQLTEEEIV